MSVRIIIAVLFFALFGFEVRAQAPFFPEQVFYSKLLEVTDFENRGHKGLGYGARYDAKLWYADVYIYDFGQSHIPSIPSLTAVRDQINLASDEIRKSYKGVSLQKETEFTDRLGQVVFLCRSFQYQHSALGNTDSALCISTWSNRFIKIRLTNRTPNSAVLDLMKSFVFDWSGKTDLPPWK